MCVYVCCVAVFVFTLIEHECIYFIKHNALHNYRGTRLEIRVIFAFLRSALLLSSDNVGELFLDDSVCECVWGEGFYPYPSVGVN